ncbi:MAG TPA: GIY-YIG nuclease family protein [Ktedonobacteraceae bacterium]|nr:GIY-YIG nuclease family protein [Ktedonobacteraceae bacterium]
MKVADKQRRNKPNWLLLRRMQLYSSRAWVYREEQGWVFAELMPDELAEFKSYQYGITIPRMRVRLPYDYADFFSPEEDNSGNYYVNWFAYCTMPQAYPLLQSKFQIHQITSDEQISQWYSIQPGDYETWLWADEVKFCQELRYKIAVHKGYGWHEWGVPPEWKPPLVYKERIFIYAIVNELTQEVYVGQTDNLQRRLVEHLRDIENTDKVALIQSIRSQGREPQPIELEEVAGEKAIERERYWTSYYKKQGYKITNHDYPSLI